MVRLFKIGLKYGFVAIVIGSLFAYAMFQGGFVSWYLFYSVVAILLLMIFVTLLPFKVKEVRRVVSAEALEAGGTVEVTVIVEKYAFQPFFFVRIFDELPVRMKQEDTPGALFFFSFQRTLAFTYSIHKLERGVYRFGDVKCKLGDIFGLIEVERTLHVEETEILVYPSFRYLQELPPVSHHRDKEGQRKRTAFQEDHSLAGVRQYVQGDRLASINWKQTARSSSLMTKEFESFQGEGAMIAFDSFMKQHNKRVFEAAIELAASMLATLLKRQSPVPFFVRLDHWQSLTLTQSLVSALQVLAYVKSNRESLSNVDGVYRKWRGMHVYYVCAELDSELPKVCKELLAQQVSLTICTPSLSSKDQGIVNEVEMLGMNVIEMDK